MSQPTDVILCTISQIYVRYLAITLEVPDKLSQQALCVIYFHVFLCISAPVTGVLQASKFCEQVQLFEYSFLALMWSIRSLVPGTQKALKRT